jgi:N-acetylmuramoyl-L-alanine amidase
MKNHPKIICLPLLVLILQACSHGPYHKTNLIYKEKSKALSAIIRSEPGNDVKSDSLKLPAAWVGTVNFGLRKPNFVILHYTAQHSCEQTLKTFSNAQTQVSAHYVICKDGTLHHMLNDYLRAWHAGAGKWGNQSDINSASVGIEIDNNGNEPFAPAQINVLLALLDTLKNRHNIPQANFIGHSDIAPSRKIDPGILFPWQTLAQKGFGNWYSDTSNLQLPADFNQTLALRIIGYDISNLSAAINAFRLHFIQSATTGELSEPERKILYAVMLKFM